MFSHFRRHKWLWVIIFGLTIISFVWFFSPSAQYGGGGAGYSPDEAVGSIGGRPITRQQYLNVMREAQLSYLFSYGEWPRNDEFSRQLGIMEREARRRFVLIEKLKEFNVQVNEASVAQWIVEAFQDQNQGGFRREDYDRFVQQTLPSRGLSAADFERFVEHQVGIQHLIALVSMGGKLLTPQEAELVYRRENEQADTEGIFFVATNFLAEVSVDLPSVTRYYTNNQANYRIPEKVQVTYVKFELTNSFAEGDLLMAKNTNLAQIIESEYMRRGTNSFRDALNQPMAPEQAKEQVREDIRKQYALLEARKKAIAFANELIELTAQTNLLANLAAAKGIVSQVSEPFSQFEQPPQLNVPDSFMQAAFQLSPAKPIHEQPILAEDGVYLIGYHQRIPSELPPLENVREQVVEDFRRSQAKELCDAAGRLFHENLTNSLAQGQTWQELAAAATNGVMLDLPPISQQTQFLPELQGRGDLSLIKNVAFSLSPEDVGSYTSTRDGGFILRLQAKVPVAEDKLKSDLPNYTDDLRRRKQSEAFGRWIEKEVELARVTLPSDQADAAN